MGILRKFKSFKKPKEDKGAAETVSFIVIVFFVMWILISFIDVGIYFNVKNDMKSAAENGARNVALYGGTDTGLRDSRSNSTPAKKVVENSIYTRSSSKVIENPEVSCGVIDKNGVKGEKGEAGDTTYCDVTYKYNGLAKGFGLFFLGGTEITAKGTAVSEVNTKK